MAKRISRPEMDDDMIDSDYKDLLNKGNMNEAIGRWDLDSKETLSKASFPLWLKD